MTLTPADIRRMAVAAGLRPRETEALLRLVQDEGEIPDADRPLLGSALEKLWATARARRPGGRR